MMAPSCLRPRIPREHVLSATFSVLLFVVFLLVYGATAAPDVLSGDSAEFQFAATLSGVPHPTTYPLATIMGHLATRLLPFGTPAWRVTMVSALCAALTVALFALLARRVIGKWLPVCVGALALGFAPGLWNALHSPKSTRCWRS